MLNLIAAVGGWLLRNFLAFAVIAIVLAFGYWGLDEYRQYQALKGELAVLGQGRSEIGAQVAAFGKSAADRVEQLSKGPAAALDQRIRDLERDIQQLTRRQADDGLAVLTALPLGGGYVDHLKRDVEFKLLKQEHEHLVRLRSSLATMRDGPAELERLRRSHASAYASLVENYNAQTRLAQDHPVATRIFTTSQYASLRQLRAAYDDLYEKNRRAESAYRFQKQAIDTAESMKRGFKLNPAPIESSLQLLDREIREREDRRFAHQLGKAFERIEAVLPMAAGILVSILLLPVAIKALFYFVLAPVVSRRPPTCIAPGASGAIEPVQPGSSVSQTLRIGAGEELLVHSQYLQSTPAGARTDTKWLLNWSYPFSSLASGLAMLTRIRVERPETVVVSSTKDPLSEIGVLSLPEGSAVVFQPRNLVGVLYALDKPLRITRHWRLASLHAWLTLQLRYLVFHGPATLVAKGCRGIRVEKAEAGRAINQAATLGFSANVLYSSTRCETFVSYLRGNQPLFNDRFAGDAGFYVYEEIPGAARKAGITGRGLEGVADSVLKVFGL